MVKRKSKEDVKTTVKVKKEKSPRQKKIEEVMMADKLAEANAPKPKPIMGRPTKYTKELAEKICTKISTTPDGLRKLCKNNDWFPNHETLCEWRFKYPDFSAQYKEAKLQQAELIAEDILDISDDSTWDEIETEHGIKMNSEFVARSRLRVDSRKWHLSKLLPKIYGDKLQTEGTVTHSFEDALKELG